MNRITVERQQLLEAVNVLPDQVLIELASFLDYLRYKSAHQRDLTTYSSSFLLAVAGLGNSGQQDVSERDEEILHNEIDPVFCQHFHQVGMNDDPGVPSPPVD